MRSAIMDKLELRERQVKVVREFFEAIYPGTSYMPFILQHKPSYAPTAKQYKVRMFMNLRLSDEEILRDVEYVLTQIKNS